jgi:hypothetical protein
MNKWVDASTIIAATAGLWALAFAWITYFMSVRQQRHDEFIGLKSVVQGLKVELALMKPWTGAGGAGYAKTMTHDDGPPDWSLPGRLIWKFDVEAISTLSSSRYVYRLGELVAVFARLNFSVSRLFQLYDEYRTYANNHPLLDGVLIDERVGRLGAAANMIFQRVIRDFNYEMHVRLIGGVDSDDPACLYKAFDAAVSALDKFDSELKEEALPWWFRIGHAISATCVLSGILLLIRLICA